MKGKGFCCAGCLAAQNLKAPNTALLDLLPSPKSLPDLGWNHRDSCACHVSCDRRDRWRLCNMISGKEVNDQYGKQWISWHSGEKHIVSLQFSTEAYISANFGKDAYMLLIPSLISIKSVLKLMITPYALHFESDTLNPKTLNSKPWRNPQTCNVTTLKS